MLSSVTLALAPRVVIDARRQGRGGRRPRGNRSVKRKSSPPGCNRYCFRGECMIVPPAEIESGEDLEQMSVSVSCTHWDMDKAMQTAWIECNKLADGMSTPIDGHRVSPPVTCSPPVLYMDCKGVYTGRNECNGDVFFETNKWEIEGERDEDNMAIE